MNGGKVSHRTKIDLFRTGRWLKTYQPFHFSDLMWNVLEILFTVLPHRIFYEQKIIWNGLFGIQLIVVYHILHFIILFNSKNDCFIDTIEWVWYTQKIDFHYLDFKLNWNKIMNISITIERIPTEWNMICRIRYIKN